MSSTRSSGGGGAAHVSIDIEMEQVQCGDGCAGSWVLKVRERQRACSGGEEIFPNDLLSEIRLRVLSRWLECDLATELGDLRSSRCQ